MVCRRLIKMVKIVIIRLVRKTNSIPIKIIKIPIIRPVKLTNKDEKNI
jgi:hypothetical protein